MTDQTRQIENKETDVNWHTIPIDRVLSELEVNPQKGLSTDVVKEREAKYGLNKLAEPPKRSFFRLIFDQLNNFVIILLIVAAIISAVVSYMHNEPYVESIAILAIIVLNSILGVVQESRAEQAMEALKKMAAPDSLVIRNGKRIEIPSEELVPGDVVLLEAGNFIPADLRLIETVNLKIDEAALTGESESVDKDADALLEQESAVGDRINSAYMGTVASYGRGKGVVASTGMNTQLGKIAALLQTVETEQTPLQKSLDQLGKTLGWAALGICAIVFAAGVLQGGEILDMFMVAVSLAIAAVPEGLPAIVTIALALGMREMVKRHALIRRLSAVETLGSATVICSDKTGTLTQNIMTVTNLWADGQSVDVTGTGYYTTGEFQMKGETIDLAQHSALSTVLWAGSLNNDSQLVREETNPDENAVKIHGDPTEGSILIAAEKAGLDVEALNNAYPRVKEIPFDSERKRMITIHDIENAKKEDYSPFDESVTTGYAVVVKGAPDVVAKLCNQYQTVEDKPAPMTQAYMDSLSDANDAMTEAALRLLGVAYKWIPDLPKELKPEELETDLIFAGLIGMIDPARPEVRPALEEAASAGIRTIMITGDYPKTGKAIAESIGLLREGHKVLTGNDLDYISDEELRETVKDTDVFARVSPEHKMRIVDALRANGEVVAMTGDGVNDAPAIKRADIGISMGITGTDVAQGAADMILTDDNYVSIVSAVEQGRIIYANIRKFVYYLVSCNLAEILIIFLPTAFGKFMFPGAERAVLSPLAPIQILWLNLITDGAPALALGTEKGDPDIMQQKPRPPKEPIINREMWGGVAVQAIAITVATLVAYFIGLNHDELYAETMAFVTLSFSELLRAYTARSARHSVFKIGVFTNKWMNIAVIFSLVLVLAVVYIPALNPLFNTEPLTATEWLKIIPLIFLPAVVTEIYKVFAKA